MLCAIFPELCSAFDPLLGCPFFCQMSKLKIKVNKCCLFPYAALIFAFTGCSMCGKQCNLGILADVWRQTGKLSPSFGLINKVDGCCFRRQLLAPKGYGFCEGNKNYRVYLRATVEFQIYRKPPCIALYKVDILCLYKLGFRSPLWDKAVFPARK